MECTYIKGHRCDLCNKTYSSRQSLWNHNNKYHKLEQDNCLKKSETNVLKCTKMSDNSLKTSDKNVVKCTKMFDKKYICKKCNKIFNNRKTKWSHEKLCKEEDITQLKDELKKKELDNKILENKFEEFKKQMVDIINKSCKIHPKTLHKINKQLNNNISNINSNNTTINNNMIIQLGKEKLYDVFSKQEQINILNNGYHCLDYLVKYAHFNPKYPQFKNIVITNLQNDIAYRYNDSLKKFEAITKEELLTEIISERMYDINEFFDKYGDMISGRMQSAIQSFITKMDSESYEDKKKKDLKIVIYNNKDEIKIIKSHLLND